MFAAVMEKALLVYLVLYLGTLSFKISAVTSTASENSDSQSPGNRVIEIKLLQGLFVSMGVLLEPSVISEDIPNKVGSLELQHSVVHCAHRQLARLAR